MKNMIQFVTKALTKEIKELKAKVAARDKEIENLKKEIRGKIDEIQALELQAELVPILRAKVKELEGVISHNQRPKSTSRLEGLPNLIKELKVQRSLCATV